MVSPANKISLIYLMGAGRSGTTLIATVLNRAPAICTIGEVHQFLDYMLNDKPCACQQQLSRCEFWSPLIEQLLQKYSRSELLRIQERTEAAESHTNLPKAFLTKDKVFIEFFDDFYQILGQLYPGKVFLDSSKYVGRAMQYRHIKNLDLKVLYVVRDIRGVVFSFGKNVQTPKSPLSAVIYYILINLVSLMAQLILGKERVKRIKYEDFVARPSETLEKLQLFFGVDLTAATKALEEKKAFEMPHIIAGNRLKENKTIELRPDLKWKENLSTARKVLYYLLSLPLQLIFRYPI